MSETWSDTFVSRYLSKRDLADGPVVGTIDYVDEEEAEGATKEKLHLLYFTGGDLKPMILKPTNRKLIKQFFGDAKRACYGKQIEVYIKDDVEFQGEVTGGLRLRLPSRPTAPAQDEGAATESTAKRRFAAEAKKANQAITKDELAEEWNKFLSAHFPDRDTSVVPSGAEWAEVESAVAVYWDDIPF
ncbi:MAG TPA: hypothetical protein VMY37_22090 [Thermoguttaceae bacterium]|nr:hypothetical protein [Thermoguttaceae bacterium]